MACVSRKCGIEQENRNTNELISSITLQLERLTRLVCLSFFAECTFFTAVNTVQRASGGKCVSTHPHPTPPNDAVINVSRRANELSFMLILTSATFQNVSSKTHNSGNGLFMFVVNFARLLYWISRWNIGINKNKTFWVSVVIDSNLIHSLFRLHEP